LLETEEELEECYAVFTRGTTTDPQRRRKRNGFKQGLELQRFELPADYKLAMGGIDKKLYDDAKCAPFALSLSLFYFAHPYTSWLLVACFSS
jgi:hypothetical protein